jgi:tyrocidine synthetase III
MEQYESQQMDKPDLEKESGNLPRLPQDELERDIEAVWREVFRLERVGREENFFELGGNSLLGMDLSDMLATRLGVQVPVLAVFQHPSIREIAEFLIAYEADDGSGSEPLDSQ